jgi:hypothetical protein
MGKTMQPKPLAKQKPTGPCPAHLFNVLREKLNLTCDKRLADVIGIGPTQLCKIRTGSIPLGSAVLLAIYDATDIPIRELKSLAGLPSVALKTVPAEV